VEYPFLTPSFEGNPLTQGYRILSQNTRIFVVAHSEVFVILVCTVLIQMDKQKDRQTDNWMMAKMRKALHAVMRKHSNRRKHQHG